MLDGLLGRGGFSSKCKSLIKLTRTRIDVIRRKRGATLKFLKKDIADLLANGLEHNAFGRAEGLISELILLSCYDFIDHVCDIILKHLSAMQKQRDCPEDCKEAAASLMFAAARFSNLPELRDLRDIFQDRYGSLEYKVNPKLVEHISLKPPAKEQKLQLLQDIASEFTIRWDSMAFEQRMTSSPGARAGHNQPKAHTPLHDTRSDYLVPQVEEPVTKKDKVDRLANKMVEVNPQVKLREALYKVENHGPTGATDSVHIQDGLNHKFWNRQEFKPNRHKSSPGPETVYRRENKDVSHRIREYMVDPYCSMGLESIRPRRVEPIHREKLGDKLEVDTLRGVQERAQQGTLSPRKIKLLPTKDENFVEPQSYDKKFLDNIVIPARKLPGKETDGLKPNFKSSIPPPYVKPKRRKDRSKQYELHGNGENDGIVFHDRFKSAEGSCAPGNEDAHHDHFTEDYYKDDNTSGDPTPRRRSRRHAKSCLSPDNGKETRVVRRVSTSRRRNESSKKGLQVLFDEDYGNRHGHRYHKPAEDEERMIEKLLLHYSKKNSPACSWGGVLGIPIKDRDELSINASESSRGGRAMTTGKFGDEDWVQQHPTRSVSLPREQMTSSSSETKKVFTRAASFDQGPSTPAKHVHPKLPDYDDLAARFAALKRT